jgi:lysozyme
MNAVQKISAAVVATLAAAGFVASKWEGTKSVAYQDHIGVWTICTGHTGPEVVKGLKATRAQCDAWLEKDLNIAYETTLRCVPNSLPNSVRAAFISFTFNVGPGGKGRKDGMCMLKSGNIPTHVKLLRSGQYVQACDMLMKWTGAGNVYSQGIYNRRVDEVKLCKADL